jgi:hypothetical protein
MCISLSCQSNSDCAASFSCYLDMGTECLTTADGGQTCGPQNACVPQWDAPCVTDADCGPGFTCSPGLTGYDCGKDQDASQPPYVTVTTVPCSAVPTPPPFLPPPDSGFPAIPPLCEAGTTCTETKTNMCVAQQTGTCTVNSDCPSTWTCGCKASCDDVAQPPGGSAVDAGCMMGCIPPNSDLVLEVCGGAAEAPSLGPSGSTPVPSSPGASDGGGETAGPSGSPAAAGSSSGGGGCQIGSDATSATWALVTAGILAAARWRPRRRSRVTLTGRGRDGSAS